MNANGNKILRIVCLDVNAREVGDSLLILAPSGQTMLIDAGMPGNGTEVVLPYLRAHGITIIDYLVSSHPHDDHFGGFPEIIFSEDITVKTILWGTPLPFEKMEQYEAYCARDCQNIADAITAACGRRNIPIREIETGEVFDFGDGINLEVLIAPNPAIEVPSDYINNNSVVMRLTYNNFSMMFAGDQGFEQEADLLAREKTVASDILKVGHHAGAGSTGEAWLTAVNPNVAVVPMPKWFVTDQRSFRVRDLFNARGIKTYRTCESGNIEIQTEGSGYRIFTQK